MDTIDDTAQRFTAIETALKAAMPGRVYKESLMPLTDHTPDEIKKGVVMLVSGRQYDFGQKLGMIAKEAKHDFLLVAHIKVLESGTRAQVQAAEFALIEEIKTFVKTGVAGMTLSLMAVEQSRQLEFPHGWVVAELTAYPNLSSLG